MGLPTVLLLSTLAVPSVSARLWPQVRLELYPSSAIGVQIDASTRFGLGPTASWDRTVDTVMLNAKLGAGFDLGGGGGWVSSRTDRGLLDLTELRAFEQASWSMASGSWQLSARARIEHRAIVNTDVLHRARVQARADWRASTRVSLYGLAESFMQLHEARAVRPGLEQQRFQVGVDLHVGPEIRVDLAFLERWLTGLNAPAEWQQVVMMTLVLSSAR